MSSTRQCRTYDHRLRELVRETRDISIATRHGVPRSTAYGWLRSEKKIVVTTAEATKSEAQLRAEFALVRRRAHRMAALLRVMFAVLRASQIDLTYERLPDGDDKRRLLRAIERARDSLRLRHILAPLGLSPSRFHAWRRAERRCELQDADSCPKTSLSLSEVQTSPDRPRMAPEKARSYQGPRS